MELIASGMLYQHTPVQDYRRQYRLMVKREDLACPDPGPHFSKTRGVYARVSSRPEVIIGVLDTYHSQAGHAVARACQILGKSCTNYYPEFKNEPGPREPQLRAQALGAKLIGIPAGRSAILYHKAKKLCESAGGYMMPNALKLGESVTETAKEADQLKANEYDYVVLPASSGTIAAGVIKGLGIGPKYLVHLGYSRSADAVTNYLQHMSGVVDADIEIVDEGYGYRDKARPGETPPWPCNVYYDLKAFRWWLGAQQYYPGLSALFWNVG